MDLQRSNPPLEVKVYDVNLDLDLAQPHKHHLRVDVRGPRHGSGSVVAPRATRLHVTRHHVFTLTAVVAMEEEIVQVVIVAIANGMLRSLGYLTCYCNVWKYRQTHYQSCQRYQLLLDLQ